MKKYKITAYIDGVKYTKFINAKNKLDAECFAWDLFDADDIYVSEVV